MNDEEVREQFIHRLITYLYNVSSITRETIVRQLISAVPEIQFRYEVDKEWLGDSHEVHSVFLLNLDPYVVELLRSSDSDAVLQRIFSFFEMMAHSSDTYVRDVLEFAIADYIDRGGSEIFAKAQSYMGHATCRMAHRVAVAWGLERPLDDDPPEIKALYLGPHPSLRSPSDHQ